jgi:hypothetical protein
VLDEAARQQNTEADFLVGLSELYLTFINQAPRKGEDQRQGISRPGSS